jgi:hypothetical protein
MGENVITKEQAIRMGESGWWNHLPAKQVAAFQLSETLLCLPFSEFHRIIEEALGRPVYTHEFGLNWDGLRKELLGEKPAPTLDEIVQMLPQDKVIVIAP